MKKKYSLIIVSVLLCGGILLYGIHWNNIVHARFNLHALGRYLHAYKIVEKQQISSFSDLPDFHLVSPSHSLELSSKDLRARVIKGYFYDFHSAGSDKFVVSASPLWPHKFSVEFGMLEDLNLRVNFYNVDAEPDSYGEVKRWSITPEWFSLITKMESS